MKRWAIRVVLMVTLFVTVFGLTFASGGASSPPPQGPQPPVLQQAPMRPGTREPPPPGTGYIPPPVDLSHLRGQGMADVPAARQPAAWDWRTQGVVPSVKNQSTCGSCYAFGSIGNFESKTLIDGAYTLPNPDFSENNAKECNWREVNNYVDPWGYSWGGCSGGNYFQLASLFSQKGVVLESCDPYVANDTGPCKPFCPYQKTLLDWRIISGNVVPGTNVLKNYIYTYGPVYTTLYVGTGPGDPWYDEFAAYDGSYTLYYTGTQSPNHAVQIVGWDDSLVHAGGTGGWIVKNSWGTGWGGPCGYGTQGGYFTIAYGSASIGMDSSFMYKWQDYDTSGGLMYYDDDCWMGWAFGYGTTTAWGLAKFIPSSNTNVTRVEFWTTDITTDVDVYIYDGFDGTSLSNLLRSDLNNSFTEAGYHSVQLASPLPVTSGDDVIAVVKFTNSSYQYPIPLDPNGPIETNRTYASYDGSTGSWTEIGTGYGHDVAIRLRTSLKVIPSCYPLTRNYTGSGSAPTANPANSSGCPSGQYHAGESITLTPHPASGYHLDHWSGTDSPSSNHLTMPASSHTVTAHYVRMDNNLLKNPSFEKGPRIPRYWKGRNLIRKDRRVCNTAHDGRCSFRVVGTAPTKSLRQWVSISGSADDSFTLSGWSRARVGRPGGRYWLDAVVVHIDGTRERHRIYFAKRTHGWWYSEETFAVDKDYNKIVVVLRYKGRRGRAWFDDLSLTKN